MSQPALRLNAEAIDWRRWLPVGEAAAALGVHPDTLTRRCRSRLEPSGLAIHTQPASGGKPRWFISRAFDPKLAEGSVEQFAGRAPDLGAWTERQQHTAWARWAIVVEFREAKRTRPGKVDDWLPAFARELAQRVAEPLRLKHGIKLRVSARSIQRWHTICPSIEHIANLIDKRGGDTRSQGSAEFWTAFKSLYLTEDRRDARACWRQASDWADERGHDAPTYRSVLRQLDRRIPPVAAAAYREPKKYRDQLEPVAEMEPEAFAAGERLEGDQRRCDVRVVMPDGKIGRPVLTAWLDWRTRRIMGHVVEPTGDADTISAAMYRVLTDPANIAGPPKYAWIDNGKDYLSGAGDDAQRRRRIDDADAPRARGLYAHLGIDLHLALPRGPRGKARIERWFREVGRRLDSFLPGHCGPSPERRPESLAKLEKNPSKNLLTLGEYRERLAAWIAGYNASDDHRKEDLVDNGGRKLSPDAAFAAWCPTRRAIRNPEALKYLLMRWGRPLTVSKRGVRIVVDGQSFYYGGSAPELIPFRRVSGRKKRYVFAAYDPRDTSHVYLFDEQLRFLTVAELNHRGGAYGTEPSRQQMKLVARDRRRFTRAVKDYRDGAALQLLTPEEQLSLTANRQRVRRAAPSAIRPVQTPIDGEVNAIRRAELKRAVGAEVTAAHQPAPSLSLLGAHHRDTPARRRRRPVPQPSLQTLGRGRS